MSTTTEAATWPRVEATLHEDGTVTVVGQHRFARPGRKGEYQR